MMATTSMMMEVAEAERYAKAGALSEALDLNGFDLSEYLNCVLPQSVTLLRSCAPKAESLQLCCHQLRACSLALRSVHDAEVPTVEPFMDFRKHEWIKQRVEGTLDATACSAEVTIVMHLDVIFDHYMNTDWVDWDNQLDFLAHELWEREWLFDAMSNWSLSQ
eukprot:832106-Amphidinium_carterae.1